MKEKPDIHAASRDAFMRAAEVPLPAPTTQARITKTIRIAPEVDAVLKRGAYAASLEASARVSESDVIERALVEYLKYSESLKAGK